ncbi:MAG: hypothetical protein KDC38_11455 [Planctomycetes bacterium]|nr:hypothetical protein [Planctomycetota bacterium]
MIASRICSLTEILDSYRDRFVLLDTCRFDEVGRLTHGRVLENSPDRDVVYNALRTHPNSVIIFAGPDAGELEGAFLDSGMAWASQD